jgi:hypothetical protein
MSMTEKMAELEAQQFVDEYLKPALKDARDGGASLWRAVLAAVFEDAVYHGDATDIDFTGPLLALAQEKAAPKVAPKAAVSLEVFGEPGLSVQQATERIIARRPPWRSGDC